MSVSSGSVSCFNAGRTHNNGFRTRNCVLHQRDAIIVPSCSFSSSFLSTRFSLRFSNSSFRSTVSRRVSTRMEWQECKAEMEVDVPASVAYNLYSDRESIPQWTSFISSVEILKDKPDLSRWTLKYQAFGQNIEYSWLARNLQPIPNQKIHWRSLEGLPNRGIVRFFPRGSTSCLVELTFSYEVPPLLVPVASALQPLMESMMKRSLGKFAEIAQSS